MTFYGCEHSVFYPYDSFFIINFYFTLSLHFTTGLQTAVYILPPVCSLRFTLTEMKEARKLEGNFTERLSGDIFR